MIADRAHAIVIRPADAAWADLAGHLRRSFENGELLRTLSNIPEAIHRSFGYWSFDRLVLNGPGGGWVRGNVHTLPDWRLGVNVGQGSEGNRGG